MSDYIVVKTFCKDEVIANKIVDELLNKKLVSGSQISRIHSKYWWNNKICECDEFKLEFRSKKILFDEIQNVVKAVHDYELPEITYYDICGGNEEIFEWISKNTK